MAGHAFTSGCAPKRRERTQNAKCDVASVQRCGVVADCALVHPLQVEAGPEDGE